MSGGRGVGGVVLMAFLPRSRTVRWRGGGRWRRARCAGGPGRRGRSCTGRRGWCRDGQRVRRWGRRRSSSATAMRRWCGVRPAVHGAHDRGGEVVGLGGVVGPVVRRGLDLEVAQLDLAVLPLEPAHLGGGLQDGELEGPGAEPAAPLEGVQLAEQGGHRLVGGLVGQVVHGVRARGRAAPRASATPGARQRGPSAHAAGASRRPAPVPGRSGLATQSSGSSRSPSRTPGTGGDTVDRGGVVPVQGAHRSGRACRPATGSGPRGAVGSHGRRAGAGRAGRPVGGRGSPPRPPGSPRRATGAPASPRRRPAGRRPEPDGAGMWCASGLGGHALFAARAARVLPGDGGGGKTTGCAVHQHRVSVPLRVRRGGPPQAGRGPHPPLRRTHGHHRLTVHARRPGRADHRRRTASTPISPSTARTRPGTSGLS